MTVCIAAISEPTVGNEYIVSASDRMVSMSGYFSGDDIVRKVDPIAYGWISMIAGNDVSPAVPILARITEQSNEESHDDTLKEMAEVFKTAYKAERLQMIEDEILSPIGFTWQTFRTDAKDQMTDRTFERLVDGISNFELDVTFLVSGFDTEGVSHIFTVCNPGKCEYYEKIGFWAIGSGQHQAIASMFANHYNRHASLEDCIAHVLAAKLAAESASGVGKETWLMVTSGKMRALSVHISRETIEAFRASWDRLPKIPAEILPLIAEDFDRERVRMEQMQKEHERNRE